MPDPGHAPDTPPTTDGGDLVAERRRKLQRLRDEFGIDPYGSRLDGLITLAQARAQYDEAADEAHRADKEHDRRPHVCVAGRVMQHRVMGNLVFLSLRDATGDLQIAVSKRAVGQPAFDIAKLIDYGDWAAACGPLAKTKTGEITVWSERAGSSTSPVPRAGSSTSPVGDEPTADKPIDLPDAESGAVDGPARGGLTADGPARCGFALVTKSLAPPPSKFHGLEDQEQRYRKRYVDLYANPDVAATMQLRIRIIDEIRRYLGDRGYLEVETPMLQTLHGGAAARPFETHHHALDLPLTLRIAPELYLKRLLVGGFPKVFEINRNFRNEGISPRHNPEFTMLEAYEAFGSWETMAELVEDMICTVAMEVFGTLRINHRGTEAQRSEGEEESGGGAAASAAVSGAERVIHLERPWRRVRMVDLVEERTGWKFEKEPLPPEAVERLRAEQPDKDLKLEGTPAEQLVEIYEKLIEPTLLDPTFVTHVPSVIIPLAKKNAADPYFADVYELAINGVEISPGYSELNDPDVQEANFRHQVGDEAEQQQVDEDFLEALRVGMPPAGGMGLGIDRLVMMFTGAASIRDVILFPLMRPKS